MSQLDTSIAQCPLRQYCTQAMSRCTRQCLGMGCTCQVGISGRGCCLVGPFRSQLGRPGTLFGLGPRQKRLSCIDSRIPGHPPSDTFLWRTGCSWLTRASRCTVQRRTSRSETTLRRRQTRRGRTACSRSSPMRLGSSPSGTCCSWLILASRCTLQRCTSRSETILFHPQTHRDRTVCSWSSPRTFGPSLADSLNTLWH